MVEKILEIPTGKIGENSRNTNGEKKIRGVVEKILEIPTGKRKFGEIRPTKKIRWLETNALDPHTWRAYVDQYSRQGTCSNHPQKNNNLQQTRHVYVHPPKIFRRIGCARARAKNNITKISNHGEKKNKKSNPLGFELKIPGDTGNAQNPEPPGRGNIWNRKWTSTYIQYV